ncbi:hypothetical protein NIES2107_60910 [Nostoc carneum NIES-2107]|nr:hypothetical protein NIES2107_60910 [Nostoc carneum NIES-2107]
MNQLTLFDLQQFTQSPVPSPQYDPAWDAEPPEPDDYPTIAEYETAWNQWERRYPELVSQVQGMTVLEQVTSDTPERSNPHFSVLEQATTNTTKSAPEQSHWIEKYPVTRYGKEHYYYRYLWMSGRKIHHVHIPGGNIESAIAKSRKSQVESAIADDQTPTEIKQLIKSWSNQ